MAHRLKNSTVNQSISAAALRLKVGSANAARQASAGSASSSTRSPARVSTALATGTPAISRGRPRCR